MANHYRVGIVGFGVGGAAAATLLARAGHSVTVFERAPALGPVGAGLLLQPSGQAVLHRLGLLETVAGPSEPIDGLHALTGRRDTLVHLRIPEVLPGRRAYGVHRGLLFETLHQAAVRAGAEILVDHEIESWQAQGGRVSAVDCRGQAHGPFDFIVAADGSRSTLRRLVDPAVAVHEYDFGALWAVGPCAAVRGYLHQITQGTRHLVGLLPVGGGRCTLFWSVPKRRMEAVRAGSFAAWREAVLKIEPLAEEVFSEVTEFEQVAFTTYYRVGMRRLFSGQVVCVGDSGHAMSPHLGQGANLALLDAETLARCLAEAPGLPEAFQSYQSRRLPQLNYYAALSRFLTPFFQSEGWILGLGRDLGLPLMLRVPPLRHEMERAMAGIRLGWLAGNLDTAELVAEQPSQISARLSPTSAPLASVPDSGRVGGDGSGLG